MRTVINTPPTSPVLKTSPNITNINEIFKDSSSASTASLLSRPLNYDVANDVITEEAEEDDPLLNLSPSALSQARSIAKEIYNQQYTKISPDQYAAFLGTAKDQSIAACIEFMSFFEPWSNSLIGSLRLLCSKLYLIGESTQIDQILELFSKSWYNCNRDNFIGDYKAIHIVCFSLFILNSDLHNEQNMESKFTKSEFVTNTIDAIKEDTTVSIHDHTTLESQLKIYYDSIETEQLEILKVKKRSERREFSNSSSNSSNSTKRVNSVSNISVRSSRHSKRYSSIGSSIFIDRETTLTDSMDTNYEVDYQKDKTDDRLEKLGPPWLIEGILKCESNGKNELRRNNKKSNWFTKLTQNNNNIISSELDIYNLKDWKQNIVIISKGLLKQYSFGSSSDRNKFMKTKSDKYVNTVMTYNLYSAVASLVDDNVISNADNRSNGVAWVLTIPNLLSNHDQTNQADKKIVYYASSLDIAQNFIETCNFWAARITSMPTTEEDIVTNAEYGWSDEIIKQEKPLQNVRIQKWEKIISIESSFIPSAYTLAEQFEQLKKYVDHLEKLIDDHNGLKPILETIWGNNEVLKNQHDLVISNWHEKYVYIYKQHQKFKIYLDSLAFSLSFRATKV